MGSHEPASSADLPDPSFDPVSEAKQSPEELKEEQRKLRRLQMMMDMVMSVIGQDATLTIDEAAEMVADSRRAALANVSGQRAGLRPHLQATPAAADARAVSNQESATPPTRTCSWGPRNALFRLDGSETEGDGAPEEAGAHLHRHVLVVVGVPDPDIAAVLDDAGIGGGLHAQGLKFSGGGLDLFAPFHLHGDGDGLHGVAERHLEARADGHGLRRRVKDCGERIGDAGGDGRLLVLADSGDEIFLGVDCLTLGVVEFEVAVHLAASFDDLLREAFGAASGAMEGRLKAVTDAEEQIDCPDRVRSDGDPLHIAVGFEVKSDHPCWKHPPVDCIVEGLFCRGGEVGAGPAQRSNGRRVPPARPGSPQTTSS